MRWSEQAIVRAAGQAQRVAVGDVDGHGPPELVLVDTDALRVVDASGGELARVVVLEADSRNVIVALCQHGAKILRP
jgi:hypothetical protein